MQPLLRFANFVENILKHIAHTGAWALIACIIFITFDVISRKVGFQIPGLGSTPLQELEWHCHAILFCTWLGYAYIKNAHVRIDVFTGHLPARNKIWLELICCAAIALPYLVVALPYAHDFFMVSYMQGESSENSNGLPYRWISKGFLYMAFVTVQLAVLAVMARCVVALYGTPQQAAEAPTPFAGPGLAEGIK